MEGGPTSYLHPDWTKEKIERLENAGHVAGVQIWIAVRDSFLVYFLYNTISSVVGIPRVIESDGDESTPLHRGTRICEGCGDREGNGARFSVCKICNENVSRQVAYCSRICQKSDWPNHKKVCGKELTPGVVRNATCSTEASPIEVFFLTQMGPARDGYTRSQALLRQMQFLEAVPFCSYVFFSPTGPRRFKSPVFITHLVFRLAVQTAMATGDERCIAAILGTIPEVQDAPGGFVDQLIEEYGKARVSVAMVAMQARVDMNDLPIMGQWIVEFLESKAGSQYAKIASEPPEGPSTEVTQKVITDLREWWPRRS
ncbi:MYND-type domain-containing protein [Mycena venus]|uniref:MYND-type domain-containing protein n=1 Tax=Mycena venus TaxID=2733690 RepID=A0A8H6Y4V4_9AGAR|nr:MYND-type domain-containing protein [Mycena venus]